MVQTAAERLNKALRQKYNNSLTIAQICGHVSNHQHTPLDKFSTELYLQKMEELYDRIEDQYSTILEECDAADKPTHETERTDLLDKLLEGMAGLRRILSSFNPQPTPQSAGGGPSTSAVKLPKLDLQKFSGDILEWRTFKDLFTAAVDSAPISNAQKLQHLKSLLGTDPLKSIFGIAITDANYAIAWKILCDRYDDKRLLISSYMKTLFGQQPLQYESASGLRKLLDTTTECERNLKALQCPTEHWGEILLHIVTQRLDSETRKLWELHIAEKTDVKFEVLGKFLSQRSMSLESMNISKKADYRKSSSPPSNGNVKKQTASHATMSSSICEVCKLDHPVWKCPTFLGSSIPDRNSLVKKHNLCFNCLRKGHPVSKSQSRNCGKCGKRHSTLLHDDHPSSSSLSSSTPSKPDEAKETSESGGSNSVSCHASNELQQSSAVLLSTACILVKDGAGNYQTCRALLDTASESTFISEACTQRLRLKKLKNELGISGVNQVPCGFSRYEVTVVLGSSRDNNFASSVVAHVVPKVTSLLPTSQVTPSHWPHLEQLPLADKSYYKPRDVDILLGADIYYECICDGLIKPSNGAPAAQRTVFGWVLGGPTMKKPSQSVVCHMSTVHMDQYLRQFWEQEEVPVVSTATAEEEACEKHFIDTHSRDSTGRYVVRLPFKSDGLALGNSYKEACSRFRWLERRLNNNATVREQYQSFMAEYIRLGHMMEVPVPMKHLPDTDVYFLPHHPVLREESSTTKLRVVFDGSAKTSSGESLNCKLMVGPIVQSDLFSILLRFRQHPFALKADIEKMFRQVNVWPADQHFQRILWRSNPHEELKQYQLTTVTYGTASAPFLSTRAINQLALDEQSSFPSSSLILRRDCYVDDVMCSLDSEEEAIRMQRELTDLLSRGGFPLRKWCSNSELVMNSIPLDMREPKLSLDFEEESTSVKTLGVQWIPKTDCFVFTVNLDSQACVTRRAMLSETARIFDPLGFLAPVIVCAKIILQDLWKLTIGWDDELPGQQSNSPRSRWLKLREELPLLERLTIPRCVTATGAVRYDLCGFSDASEKAYSCAIYLRSSSASGSIHCSLLTAKTRVAPTKVISLPRLELCGAELLSRLIRLVSEKLTVPITSTRAWSDSTIVLHWIGTESSKLKTFIANRVSKIQSILPRENWSHVVSADNPADPASRGLLPSQFLTCDIWWKGPDWLTTDEFPMSNEQPNMDLVNEAYKREYVVVANVTVQTMFLRWSSLTKLKFHIAIWLRFISNMRLPRDQRVYSEITAMELRVAFLRLVGLAQSEVFSEEIDCMRTVSPLPRKSKLAGLAPFLDKDGLIRAGGRLRRSKLPYDQKHPVIVPYNHKLAELIFDYFHRSLLHAGPTLLLSALRQRGLWVINAKKLARSTPKKCVPCVRLKAATSEQAMADLPGDRFSTDYPFKVVGVDYAGPFELKQIHGKATKIWKAYVSVFVCFATKGIHLECVRDLTTEAFIAAFRRFCGHKGRPSIVYSDNGTNFHGAARELAN